MKHTYTPRTHMKHTYTPRTHKHTHRLTLTHSYTNAHLSKYTCTHTSKQISSEAALKVRAYTKRNLTCECRVNTIETGVENCIRYLNII